MSATNKTQTCASEYRSLDIACHIESIRAIADLIATVGGNEADGSDSKVEDLNIGTLGNAMYAIRQHLEIIEEIQSEQDKWIRKEAAARAAGLALHDEVGSGVPN